MAPYLAPRRLRRGGPVRGPAHRRGRDQHCGLIGIAANLTKAWDAEKQIGMPKQPGDLLTNHTATPAVTWGSLGGFRSAAGRPRRC